MNESRSISFEAAVAFELSLGALAMLLGWLLGHDVLAKTFRGVPFLAENGRAFLVGLLATVPLVLALLALERWPPSWLGEIKESVQQIMAPLLLDAGWAGRVSLALAAGIGEELLFRGLTQDWLATYLGAAGAVIVGALVFGLCHAISIPYLIVASLIGAFLGTLYVATGNLLAPIVCHAAYDVFAMQRLLPGKGDVFEVEEIDEAEEPIGDNAHGPVETGNDETGNDETGNDETDNYETGSEVSDEKVGDNQDDKDGGDKDGGDKDGGGKEDGGKEDDGGGRVSASGR